MVVAGPPAKATNPPGRGDSESARVFRRGAPRPRADCVSEAMAKLVVTARTRDMLAAFYRPIGDLSVRQGWHITDRYESGTLGTV